MSMQYNEPRRSGMGWKIAVAVLAVAVLALLAVVFVGRPGQNSAATHTTSSPAAPAASTAPPAAPVTTSSATPETPATTATTDASSVSWSDTGCNGSTGSSGSPVTALAKATWKPFLTTSIPSSPDLGPAKVTGVLRECYQHSPAGAVMAAANLVLAPLAPNGEQAVQKQWTAGPGRDDELSALASYSGATGGIAGYRLDGCQPEACNVQLITFGSGKYAQSSLPLIWVDGDWVVDGSQHMPAPGLVAGIPAGFTAWGATS